MKLVHERDHVLVINIISLFVPSQYLFEEMVSLHTKLYI